MVDLVVKGRGRPKGGELVGHLKAVELTSTKQGVVCGTGELSTRRIP